MKANTVIQHPRAAVEPVQQTRGVGRLPKAVYRLRDHQHKRWCEGRQQEVISKQVSFLRKHLNFLEESKARTVAMLMWLQRANLSNEERAAAARYLEWENLPWQEKERQGALGFQAPDCPF